MNKKIAHLNAVIELAVQGTDSAQKKLEQVGKVKQKLEKDNTIQYIVDVDKGGLAQIKEIKDELDLKDKDLMHVGFNKESADGTKKDVRELINWIQQAFNNVKWIDDSQNGLSSAISKEIEGQKSKLKELEKILAKQQKIYAEQAKIIEDAKQQMASDKDAHSNRYINDVVSQFKEYVKIYQSATASDDDAENASRDLSESFKLFLANSVSYDDLSKLQEAMPSKSKEGKAKKFNELLAAFADEFELEYNEDANEVIKALKNKSGFEYLKKRMIKQGYEDDDYELSENIQSIIESATKIQNETSLKIKDIQSQINSLQAEIKKSEENARKTMAKTSSNASESRSLSDRTQDVSEIVHDVEDGGVANIQVKPANLDNFYKEIEDHKKAHIEVTLETHRDRRSKKQEDVDTINVKTKLDVTESLGSLKTNIENTINPIHIELDQVSNLENVAQDIKDKIDGDNGLYKQIDSLVKQIDGKYSKSDDILTQIRGIINVAKSSEEKRLTQEQKSQITALAKAYENKTGNDFNYILKEIGERKNSKVLDGLGKDIEAYQAYLNEKSVTVPINVELNPASMESLVNKVKNALPDMKVKLDTAEASGKLDELSVSLVKMGKKLKEASTSVNTKDDAHNSSNLKVTSKRQSVAEAADVILQQFTDYVSAYKEFDSTSLISKMGEIIKSSSESGKSLSRLQEVELAALDAVYQRKEQTESALQNVLKSGKIDSSKIFTQFEDIVKLTKSKHIKELDAIGQPVKTDKKEPIVDDKPKTVSVTVKINNEKSLVDTLKDKINTINPIDVKFNPDLVKLKDDIYSVTKDVAVNLKIAAAKESPSDNKEGSSLSPTTTSTVTISTPTTRSVNVSKSEQNMFNTFDHFWTEFAVKTEADIYDKIAAIFRGTLKKKDPQLNQNDAAKVVALKELYKVMSGKDSPVSDILKSLGVTDFGTVLEKNYKKAQDAFVKQAQIRADKSTTTVVMEQSPKKQQSTTSVDVGLNVKKGQIPSLKKSIEKGVNPINVELKPKKSEFENSVKSIVDSIDVIVNPKLAEGFVLNIDNANIKNTTADANMQNEQAVAHGVDSATIDNEKQHLSKLKKAVESVTDAVEDKTDEFIDEESYVASVVNKEIQHLDKLNQKLQEVQKNAHISIITSEENPHYLTDPQGNEIVAYRGIHDAYGGLVSNRYHGGTFFSDSQDLAKAYAGGDGKIEKVKLSMKNPLEFDAKGAEWNNLEFFGYGENEISEKALLLQDLLSECQNEIAQLEQQIIELDDFTSDTLDACNDEYNKRMQLLHEMSEWWYERRLSLSEQLGEISADSSNPYGVLSTNQLVEYAQSAGYDGVVFKNIRDGSEEINNVFVTLKEEQIHFIETIKQSFSDLYNEYVNNNLDDFMPNDMSEYNKASLSALDGNYALLAKFNNKIKEIAEQYIGLCIEDVNAGYDFKDPWLNEDGLTSKAMSFGYSEGVSPFLMDAVNRLDTTFGSDWFEAANAVDLLVNAVLEKYSSVCDDLRMIMDHFHTTAITPEEYEAEQAAKFGQSQVNAAAQQTDVATQYADNSAAIANEKQHLETLQQTIDGVTEAVHAKTKAFINEKQWVEDVVSHEISNLEKLQQKLRDVKDDAHISITTSEENPHILTDPQGNEVIAYRGIHNAYGGLVSNRYHGGTFFTNSKDLAKQYAGADGKIEKAKLSMKNPFEFDAQGSVWHNLEYIGHGEDELSRRIHLLKLDIKTLDQQIADAETLLESSKPILQRSQEEHEACVELFSRIQDLRSERQNVVSELDGIYEDTSNPYGMYTTNTMVEYAKSAGYDGVVFKNIQDGAESIDNVFVTLKEEQIHFIEVVKETFDDATAHLKEKFGSLDGLVALNDAFEEIQEVGRAYQMKKFNSDFIDKPINDFRKLLDSGAFYKELQEYLQNNPVFNGLIDLDGLYTRSREYTEEDWKAVRRSLRDRYDNGAKDLLAIQKKFNTKADTIEEYEAEQSALRGNATPAAQKDTQTSANVNLNADIASLNANIAAQSDGITPIKVHLDANIEDLRLQLAAITPPLSTSVNLEPNIQKLLTDIQSMPDLTIDINPGTDSTAETVRSIKDAISSSLNTEFKSVGESVKAELEGANASVDTLTTSIKQIGETFKKATATIGRSSKTQIKNINSVKEVVENLNAELVKTITSGDFTADSPFNATLEAIRKEKEELLKQQEELNAQKQEFEKQKQEDKKDKESNSKKKKKDDDSVSESTKNKADAIVDNYKKVLKDLDLDNLEPNKFVNGTETKIVDKIKELQDSGDKLQQEIIAGGLNDEQLKSKIDLLKDIVKQIKELNVAENQILAKGGEAVNALLYNDSLFNVDKRKIEQDIKDAYLSQYNKILSDPKYKQSTDPKKGTVVAKVLDDGHIKKITFALEEYGKVAGQTSISVRQLTNDEGKYMGAGSKWLAGLKAKIRNLSQYVTGINLVMRAWNEVRKGFSFVKELDAQLTTINQTMSVTHEELAKIGSSSIETAKNLGTTAQNVLQAVAIYANANETAKSILEKAQPTIMLANASGIDTSLAADQIQGVVNQFEELEGQERRIVNSYEKISAGLAIDFATGINRMAEGVQTAGSVVEAAGMKFETFAASIGKISEKTRQEGSVIGNAYKTIMARISRSKSADEEVSDDDRSNASKAFASVGISLYNSAGEYKDINETLDELVAIWDDLTDAQRNYIAEQAAGVRNINVFTQLIDTWSEAKELANDALSDTDFIDETQLKYMESMQAHLSELQASIQGFWNTVLDTEVINFGIDLLSGIVKILDTILDTASNIGGVFGSWGSALATAATVGGALFGVYKGGGALKELLHFKTKKDLMQELSDTIAGNIIPNQQKEQKSDIVADGEKTASILSKLGSKATETFGAMASASKAAGGGIKGVMAAIKALAGAVGTVTLVVTGLVAAVGATLVVFDAATDSTEETRAAVEKLNESYKETQTTLQNNKKTISSIADDFEKLSDGVKPATGENISLTTEEYERYHDVCNQIAAMYPDLVQSYDAQGNAILKLKGNVEELNKAYDEQRLKAAQDNLGNYQNGGYENLETYVENFKNVVGQRSWGTKVWDVISSDMFGSAEIGGRVTSGEVVDALEELQKMTYDEVKAWMSDNYNTDIGSWLRDSNNFGLTGSVVDDKYIVTTSEEEWLDKLKTIPTKITEISAEINSASSSLRNGLQSYLTTLELTDAKYANVDDNVFAQVNNLIASLSNEQLEKLASSEEGIQSYVTKWLNTLSKYDNQISFSSLLNLDKDTTIEEMTKVINGNLPTLAKALGYEDEDEIAGLVEQLGLTDVKELVDGFEEDVEEINESLNKTNKETKDQVKYHEKIKKFIEKEKVNTKDELQILKQCANEAESWAEAMEEYAYRSINIATNASEIEALESNLTKVEETIEGINDARNASQDSVGLNKEQIDNITAAFEDLKDEAGNSLFNYDKLFESSAEGVRLNAQELDRLIGEYEKFERAKYDDELLDLEEQYGNLCVAIDNASTATEKNKLINQRNDLLEQIKQTQELKSRYEGLTNAVTKYQQAKNLGEEGDTYLSLVGDKESIKELYDNGLVGTNQFKAAVQMMTNEDLSGASVDAYIKTYQAKWKQFSSWLTEDASGLQTFLSDLQEKGFASVDENGFWSIDGDIEAMSSELGTSQALIQEIFKRLKDFGFDVDFVEETDHLKELRKAAVDARDALTGDNAQYQLDLTVTDKDAIRDQIQLGQKLSDELKASGKVGTQAYEDLQTEMKYLRALAGETADALDWSINYDEDKDLLDGIVGKLKSIDGYSDLYINLATSDIDNVNKQLDNVLLKLFDCKDPETGKIDLSAPGATELINILFALINQKNELTNNPVVVKLDSNNFTTEQAKIIDGMKELNSYLTEMNRLDFIEQNGLGAALGIDVEKEKTALQEDVNAVLASLNIDENRKLLFDLGFTFNEDESIIQSDLQGVLNNITAEKLVGVGFELSEEDKATLGYVEADVVKEVDADTTKANQKIDKLIEKASQPITMNFNQNGLNPIKNTYDSIQNKTVTVTTIQKTVAGANGNANANGNARHTLLQRGLAFAQGTWGAAKNAASLVGELGQELV